jgi:hypothetical protein
MAGMGGMHPPVWSMAGMGSREEDLGDKSDSGETEALRFGDAFLGIELVEDPVQVGAIGADQADAGLLGASQCPQVRGGAGVGKGKGG